MQSYSGLRSLLAATLLTSAMPALAGVRMLIDHAAPVPQSSAIRFDLTVLNPSQSAVDFSFPETVQVQLTWAGKTYALVARRTAAEAMNASIGPSGFREAAYQITLPQDAAAGGGGLLSIEGSDSRIAVASPASDISAGSVAVAAAPVETGEAAVQEASADRPFFANFSAYEPIYAVYGRSHDNDTRIQFSLKYQLFGDPKSGPGERRWIDNFYIAYTQRIFMDIGEKSNPIHAIDFQPEFFYQWQPRAIGGGTELGGQLGLRHVSNGDGGLDSRSYNLIFVRPQLGWDFAGQHLTLSPSAWAYLGKDTHNPDIARYRGYTGLGMTFGSEKGLMLTADSKYSFGSGKGAVEGTLSYPLSNLIDGYNVHIFAQGFTGYGENLLDYNRRSSHVRFGIGLVR